MTLFGLTENYSELDLSLDQLCRLSNPSIFPFVAEGKAMNPTIYGGDLLLVDRSITPCSGMIVIVDIEGERLCRRLFVNNQGHKLCSDNKKYREIVSQELQLFGVVVWNLRNLLDDHSFS